MSDLPSTNLGTGPDTFTPVPNPELAEGADDLTTGVSAPDGTEAPSPDPQAAVEQRSHDLSPIQAARLALGPPRRERSTIKPTKQGDELFVPDHRLDLRAGKDDLKVGTSLLDQYAAGRGGIGTAKEEIAKRFPEKG